MAHMMAGVVVDQLYAAMRQGDTDAILRLLADDVLIVVPGRAGLGAAGEWHGHAGAIECFRRLAEGQLTERLEFLEQVADGELVVCRLHATALVRATGRRFESDIIHMFTVVDGKVRRLLDFFDTAAVLSAYDPANTN